MAKRPQQSKSVFRNFLVFLFVFILLASILSIYNSPLSKPEEVPFNTVVEYVQQGKVKDITITEGADLTIQLNDPEGTTVKSQKEGFESLPTVLQAYGVTPDQLQKTTIIVKGESGWKYFLVNIFPILLPAIFIILFFWMMLRQVQGTNNRALMFGQLKNEAGDPEKQKQKINFKDVAGATEAKEELTEVVDFLKYPKKYLALGARIPKGVLLMGPPGTGKTLLARAVAGEANVPFFHISGSEFVEMFVGVGASRVRDFFKKAKKASPAILFIDEIDAVGRQRGTGLGGSHDEREQTLNQILTEMDGFETDENVIVIAATNRPDVLDPALLRPGRFDRRVILDYPDIKEREAILNVHARNKIFQPGVTMTALAQRTIGFSGADLMNLLNEAAISAARFNRKKISIEDCFESVDKVLLGPQRKSAKFSDKEKTITAYHEAGHALVAHIMPDSDPVHKISIIPRGRAGGFTLKLPEEDKKLHSKKELLADIAVSLGGHIAEHVQFDDITTGASNDLEKATKLARNLITRYGMSEKMGPRTFGATSEMVFLGKEIHEQKDYSEETAREIDVEINSIIHTQYIIAKNIILKYKDRLDAIVAKLKEVETLERKDFEALFPEFVGQTSHERKEEEKKKSRSSIRPLTSPSAAT
ncbi:MAG TPA: ATP-dependent zinc metalloprotease FtsH [Patescibacteria group bacterium]|nr:ATP-dependent zinc metalloprotease FtsH [Patescibacteria group bacterium]